MKINIPKGARRIIEILRKEGYEAVIVGGCVRDSLLGLKPGDYDIATSATPNEIISVFKGFTVVPTGIKHGTVTIVINGTNYEVTTYRIDGNYVDGRRPNNVSFTPSLYEDLKRRDFTINAFAYNDEIGLIDYYDGVSDLANKIIRCVGDPVERFSEDYLRMLRAYRFAAVLGFSIDENVKSAIKAKKHHITLISAERIRMEVDKLLLSDNFDVIKHFLNEFNEKLFPEIQVDFDVMRRTERVLCQRIAALFHNCENAAETAVKLLKKYKYDNVTINLTRVIIISRKMAFTPNKPTIKRLMRDFGESINHCLAYFAACDPANEGIAAECTNIISEIHRNNEPHAIFHLAINGTDLIAAGVIPGRAVGDMLAYLLEKVIDEPSLNNKNQLEMLIKQNLLEPPKSR